jgi:hypothetical protein
MTKQNQPDHASITERLSDVAGVEEVLKRAGRQAEIEHARAGHKIPVWRDNQIVWEDAKSEEGNEE